MLFRKCMVAAALSVGIATASFALVASDASFGVEESPAIVTAPLEDPEQQGPTCPGVPDCNGNGEDDRCDLDCSASGNYCVGEATANDLCNGGHFPSCGTSEDCNENGTPDECEGVECCVDSDCPRFQCCGQQTANQCGFCQH